MVHRYEPADLLAYNDKYLTKVSFISDLSSDPYSPGNEFTVNIYKGGSYVSGVGFNPGTLVYSEQVPTDSIPSQMAEVIVILDSAIAIDATQEMWIGIQTGPLRTLCFVNSTTAEPMKGNVCYRNGLWTTLSFEPDNSSNWDIKGWVEGGGTIVSSFYVYRDGALLPPVPVTSRNYIDTGVPIGTHTYGVSALYNADTCESTPVTTQVTMMQDTCETFVINTFPWRQDFENEFWQNCITTIDANGNGYGWYRLACGSHDAHSGTYTAASNSYSIPNDYLVMPPLLVPPSGIRLSYWVAPNDTLHRAEHYEVLLSTTGSDTADFSTSLYSETISFSGWTFRNIDIPGTLYAGQTVHIVFVHNECYNMDKIKIDDITIENLGDCLTPIYFITDNISNTTATIGWTQSGFVSSWNVEYGVAGFVRGTGTSIVIFSNTYQLTALAPNTTYDVYVQANCGINGTSEWLKGTFTTTFDNLHYETFEDYVADEYIAESAQAMGRTFWTTWSGSVGGTDDALVSSDQASGGINSLKITNNDDCVLLFPFSTSGTHNVEADFYIPYDKQAYFSILQNFGNTINWGVEIYFIELEFGYINAGIDSAATFTYHYDQWFHIKFFIDLDSDYAEFYLSDSLIYSWQWSLGVADIGIAKSLHAIDFYGNGEANQYYVDNIDYDYMTGIQQNYAKDKLFIYPNPASNLLHIVGTADYENVEIIDFLGQIVYTDNIVDNYTDVNISNLSSGIYFDCLKGSKGTISGKFIKK